MRLLWLSSGVTSSSLLYPPEAEEAEPPPAAPWGRFSCCIGVRSWLGLGALAPGAPLVLRPPVSSGGGFIKVLSTLNAVVDGPVRTARDEPRSAA